MTPVSVTSACTHHHVLVFFKNDIGVVIIVEHRDCMQFFRSAARLRDIRGIHQVHLQSEASKICKSNKEIIKKWEDVHYSDCILAKGCSFHCTLWLIAYLKQYCDLKNCHIINIFYSLWSQHVFIVYNLTILALKCRNLHLQSICSMKSTI